MKTDFVNGIGKVTDSIRKEVRPSGGTIWFHFLCPWIRKCWVVDNSQLAMFKRCFLYVFLPSILIAAIGAGRPGRNNASPVMELIFALPIIASVIIQVVLYFVVLKRSEAIELDFSPSTEIARRLAAVVDARDLLKTAFIVLGVLTLFSMAAVGSYNKGYPLAAIAIFIVVLSVLPTALILIKSCWYSFSAKD